MNCSDFEIKTRYPEKADYTTWVLTNEQETKQVVGRFALFELTPEAAGVVGDRQEQLGIFMKLSIPKMLARVAPWKVQASEVDAAAYHKACAEYYAEQEAMTEKLKNAVLTELEISYHPKAGLLFDAAKDLSRSGNPLQILEIGKKLKPLIV